MRQFYYIKTCNTSVRILKQLPHEAFELIDIKNQPLTVTQIEYLESLAGSYETLFSRRAKRYAEMDLKNQTLEELDYKRLILDEYTFLKRPVVVIDDQIFVGSSKKIVSQLLDYIKTLNL